jgi:GT2 family glycosyltransferase
MRISYIIVTWNSAKHIEASVGGLCNYVNHEDIIIIDNGSSDDTVTKIKSISSRIHIIQLPVNTGFGIANNIGLNLSTERGYDYAYLLNADTVIDHAPIDLLKNCESTNIGAISPIIVESYDHGIIQSAGGYICYLDSSFRHYNNGKIYRQSPKIVEVDWVLGAAMILNLEAINVVGGFDLDYTPAYVEETDLCLRLKRAGYKVNVSYRDYIIHIGKQSAGTSKNEYMRLVTNRLKFIFKNIHGIKKTLSTIILLSSLLISFLMNRHGIRK